MYKCMLPGFLELKAIFAIALVFWIGYWYFRSSDKIGRMARSLAGHVLMTKSVVCKICTINNALPLIVISAYSTRTIRSDYLHRRLKLGFNVQGVHFHLNKVRKSRMFLSFWGNFDFKPVVFGRPTPYKN